MKDLTLHIAALSPAGIDRDDIPADLVESEKEIARKELEARGVPANESMGPTGKTWQVLRRALPAGASLCQGP